MSVRPGEQPPRDQQPGGDRPPEPPRSEYPDLVEGFSRFVGTYCDTALEAIADDPDIRPTAEVLAASAKAAADALSAELRRIYEESSAATRSNVERQLRVSGGLALVRAANEAITSPGAKNRSVLGWISLIIFLLKKLITILFPNIPHWLDLVIDFIDEIIEPLQHLLGGREAARLEREMAEAWLRRRRLMNLVGAPVIPMAEAGEN